MLRSAAWEAAAAEQRQREGCLEVGGEGQEVPPRMASFWLGGQRAACEEWMSARGGFRGQPSGRSPHSFSSFCPQISSCLVILTHVGPPTVLGGHEGGTQSHVQCPLLAGDWDFVSGLWRSQVCRGGSSSGCGLSSLLTVEKAGP